jgi:hypothetical protein
MNKIPLTEEAVKFYLDKCIVFWRKKRKNGTDEEKTMAVYYIDAYQSMRTSFFDELLPDTVDVGH